MANVSPAGFRSGVLEGAGGSIACRVSGAGPMLATFATGAPGLLAGGLSATRRVMAFEPGSDIAAIAAALSAEERFAILSEPGGEGAALRLALATQGKVQAVVLVAPAPAAEALGAEITRLHEIAVPVLLLFGTRDKVTPSSNGRGYSEGLPIPYVTHVYDAGHPPDDDRLDAVLSVTSTFLRHPESFTVSDRDERRYP